MQKFLAREKLPKDMKEGEETLWKFYDTFKSKMEIVTKASKSSCVPVIDITKEPCVPKVIRKILNNEVEDEVEDAAGIAREMV